MTAESGNIRNDIMWRVSLIYIFMVLFAFAIIGRIIYLQFGEKEIWTQKAKQFTLRNITIEPNRGDICAIDGRTLSSSVPYYNIYMDPNSDAIDEEVFNKNIDSLSICLSNLFKDRTVAQYKSLILNAKRQGKRYLKIQKNITYRQLKKVKKFPLFRLGQYKGGLIIESGSKRVKPFKGLAARTIGSYEDNGNIPKIGLEGAYDRYLRGVQGFRLMQKIPGNEWKPISDGNEVDPVDGVSLITTIDVDIQDVAETALLNQLEKHEADHGCAVLMEVSTGEIRAIANLKRTSQGFYYEARNYAVWESIEPGSTFKLVSLMIALEDGFVDLNDSIETGNGVTKYYDLIMKDTHPHGKITVKEVFEYSSNVGVSKIITQYYSDNPQRFVDRIYNMHLNDKLGLEIYGEGKPVIKYPGDSLWSGVSLPQMSIGYEVKLTPLQILTFYNAVANDGVMVKPMFVKYMQYHGDTIKEFEPQIINNSICQKQTLEKVKEMLLGVVEKGTAKNIKNNIYKIAGKTGTAQIANQNLGYGTKKDYIASFVGYFPADNPKYSCIVVIHSPQKGYYYGSSVAAPVFKEIADKVYATDLSIHEPLNTQPTVYDCPSKGAGYKYDYISLFKILDYIQYKDEATTNWVKVDTSTRKLLLRDLKFNPDVMPDVRGMTIEDAVFLLENIGVRIKISGKRYGKVVKQSIKPGESVKENDTVNLIMA